MQSANLATGFHGTDQYHKHVVLKHQKVGLCYTTVGAIVSEQLYFYNCHCFRTKILCEQLNTNFVEF